MYNTKNIFHGMKNIVKFDFYSGQGPENGEKTRR